MLNPTYEDFKKEVNTLNLEGVFDVDDYYEEDVDKSYSIYSFKDFEGVVCIQYFTDDQQWVYMVKDIDTVGEGNTLEDAIVDFNFQKTRFTLVTLCNGCTIRSLIEELEIIETKYPNKTIVGDLQVTVSSKGIEFLNG
jgi:hypothetical protein